MTDRHEEIKEMEWNEHQRELADLRARLATEREAGERAMWEKMAGECAFNDKGHIGSLCFYEVPGNPQKHCEFDSCPLRAGKEGE